jgi:hypothetical protein
MEIETLMQENAPQGGLVHFGEQLQALNDMGFTKIKLNTKLLLQTGGNFEIVLDFLVSKKKLKEALVSEKTRLKQQRKETKIRCKGGHKEKRDRGSKHKLDRESFRREKKAERRSRKGEKASSEVVPFPISANLPVYLDGNNMMFVCSSLRSLVLNRQKRLAEQILASLAREFAIKLNLPKCVLIFDDTDKHEESNSFVVCSARPLVSTSDDALVEWAESNQRAHSPVGIFVTSDRELRERLLKCAAVLVKPKEWFRSALETLTGKPVDDLDACFTAWLNAEGLTKP